MPFTYIVWRLVFKVYSNVHVHLMSRVLLDTHAQSLATASYLHSDPVFTTQPPKEKAFCLSGKDQSLIHGSITQKTPQLVRMVKRYWKMRRDRGRKQSVQGPSPEAQISSSTKGETWKQMMKKKAFFYAINTANYQKTTINSISGLLLGKGFMG